MAKKKKKSEIILTPEQQREADYQKAVRRMEGAEKMLQAEDKVHMYREAIRMFEELDDYEDSQVRKKRCRKRLPLARREHREEVYQEGMRLKSEAKSAADYEAAIAEFRRLRREYKDIPDQISAKLSSAGWRLQPYWRHLSGPLYFYALRRHFTWKALF